jgi:L-lactate dehydrogenase (cytochrome)
MGRTFMYSVGALGAAGGDHAINILKLQLKQVMDQVCCAKVEDLVDHLKR